MEGPVERVSKEELLKAIREVKAGKAAGPSWSEEIEIGVMVELCPGVLNGREMPNEWALSVVVLIFEGKGEGMSCGAYRGVKLLQFAIKIVEKVQEKRLRCMMKVDEMQLLVLCQANELYMQCSF